MQFNQNSFRWLLGGLLAASLIAFTITQQEKIREQVHKIKLYENRVASLESLLQAETATTQALRQENETLRQENQILRDSIQLLTGQVRSLTKKLRAHQATLRGIREELAKKERELQRLKSELADAQAQGKVALSRAEQLEANIRVVEKQQHTLRTMQAEEVQESAATEDDLLRAEMEVNRKKLIEDIVQHTSVDYKKVRCSKTRSGKLLTKLEEDGTNWVYTAISLDMNHPNPQVLGEQYFMLRIVNPNTGEELPYLESNPAFSGAASETKGFAFQWKGNPTELVYINMQAKTGKNYEMRLFFLSDDREFLLPSSIRPIIKNGKVVN